MIAVIGGGAAGMTAAIAAGRSGARVMMFEKEDRVGRKLLATGNGRCNITNLKIGTGEAKKAYHGSAARLIRPVFKRFGLTETEAFFQGIGIAFRSDDEASGRLYPYNFQASSVQDALRYEVERLGTQVHPSEQVLHLLPEASGFCLRTQQATYHVPAVILACGGQAAPRLGSDGSGFRLARELGLKVINPQPALVRLKSDFRFAKHLDGTRFLAAVSLCEDGHCLRRETDDLLFTDDGVSGPAVMQVSSIAVRRLAAGGKPYLEADLYPDVEEKELKALFQRILRQVSYKPVSEALNGLVHKKMIPVLLSLCELPSRCLAQDLSEEQITQLAVQLKHLHLNITGDGGFAHAQVTMGGVAGYEVDDRLEAVKLPGLFLAGEILDIDGDCGGYNLQWAFSSGYTAGLEAKVYG